MDKPVTIKFFRNKLPHWLVADRAYFVTIRLNNTLPAYVLEDLKREQVGDEKRKFAKRREQFIKIEQFLDSSAPEARLLDNPDVAKMLMENFSWFKTKGWLIYATVVLSTHIHMLMRSQSGCSGQLIEHLSMFKNYTSRMANKTLEKKGRFWSQGDFDHWIRTPEKFESTVRYIVNNPVKAGRVKAWDDWPWVKVHDEVRYCLEE